MSIPYHPHQLLAPAPPPPASHGQPSAYPTALLFDPFSDLLWSGSSSGSITAFASPQSFARTVTFPAHGSRAGGNTGGGGGGGGPGEFLGTNANANAVQALVVGEREVVSLTARGVGGRKRGGAAKWAISDGATALNTMCMSPSNGSEIVVGGAQPTMMVVNSSTGAIVRSVESLPNLLYLRRTPKHVAAGSADGTVRFHDPRSLKQTQAISAHLGGLSGLESSGWNVLTFGYTVKQGHPMPDPMVKIFDVRTCTELSSLAFEPGPAFVLPSVIDHHGLVVASAQGTFMTVDIERAWEATFHQLDVSSYVTSAAISTSGSYLAFGDAEGSTHVWSSTDPGADDAEAGLTFNGFGGVLPEFADEVPPLPKIDWNETTPLNTIGMPYYDTPLLSNLPSSAYCPPASSPFFNAPTDVPPSVLSAVRQVDFVGYAQTPRELKGSRHRVASSVKGRAGKGGKTRRVSEPRFRSEREKDARWGKKDKEAGAGALEATAEDEGQAMNKYRKVEIKYSKFGIEDFDFSYYNATRYSGLETHIANSYTNAVLQALHYTLPFRALAKSHISSPCPREHCLFCEAGFLFRMLEDAQGVNCQASNFSRAFGGTPQATALGLYDAEDDSQPPRPYAPLIQNFTRFALEHMATESWAAHLPQPWLVPPPAGRDPHAPAPSVVSQVLGLDFKQTTACLVCGAKSVRPILQHTLDLAYPRQGLSNEPAPAKDFCSVLQQTVVRDSTTKAVCNACKQFAPLRTRRVLADGAVLPPVLCVNAAVHSADIVPEFWTDKAAGAGPFLPPSFGVGQAAAAGASADVRILPPATKDQWPADASVYELRALVVETHAGTEDRHLVSIVKIPVDELDPDAPSPWFVFNDFLVESIPEEEALSFTAPWKTPALMIYERSDAQSPLDLSPLPMGIDPSILNVDVSMSWRRNPLRIKHRNLSPEELPGPDSLIPIDAEFVAMQLDDLELRSDGTRKVIRPSRLSLARVSCLRGTGAKEELPFIDDHIHTSEPVVDYLTDYSGIHHGDLDPHVSEHTLVPLKVAYKKLRLLVDQGCTFIGHGLSKDFRIINIYVPPAQVFDTVDIYSSPLNRRKISLKFLSWFLLKSDIQSGEHDSIEDARAALRLWKLAEKFKADGRFDDVMEDIFAEGKRLNWKPPLPKPTSPSLASTQPPTPSGSTPAPAPASSSLVPNTPVATPGGGAGGPLIQAGPSFASAVAAAGGHGLPPHPGGMHHPPPPSHQQQQQHQQQQGHFFPSGPGGGPPMHPGQQQQQLSSPPLQQMQGAGGYFNPPVSPSRSANGPGPLSYSRVGGGGGPPPPPAAFSALGPPPHMPPHGLQQQQQPHPQHHPQQQQQQQFQPPPPTTAAQLQALHASFLAPAFTPSAPLPPSASASSSSAPQSAPPQGGMRQGPPSPARQQGGSRGWERTRTHQLPPHQQQQQQQQQSVYQHGPHPHQRPYDGGGGGGGGGGGEQFPSLGSGRSAQGDGGGFRWGRQPPSGGRPGGS